MDIVITQHERSRSLKEEQTFANAYTNKYTYHFASFMNQCTTSHCHIIAKLPTRHHIPIHTTHTPTNSRANNSHADVCGRCVALFCVRLFRDRHDQISRGHVAYWPRGPRLCRDDIVRHSRGSLAEGQSERCRETGRSEQRTQTQFMHPPYSPDIDPTDGYLFNRNS